VTILNTINLLPLMTSSRNMRRKIVRQTPGIPFRELARIRALNPVN
jgi:hypothetical protein